MAKKIFYSVSGHFAYRHLSLLLVLLLTCFASCQSSGETETTETNTEIQTVETEIDSVRLAARRPAPDFYILTPEIAKNRVFICDDPYSDVFHTDYGCKLLGSCHTTIKNVTLLSAIRKYGRYNCKICSSELDHIYDRDLVR